jgi:cytosine/adenosine deaminase-related metal-dependent hydrolase
LIRVNYHLERTEIQAGLSNYEVLRTATINASRVRQKLNKVGSIEEGKAMNRGNLVATVLRYAENLIVEK